MESGKKGFISETKLLQMPILQAKVRPFLLLFEEAASKNISRHESSFDFLQPLHTRVAGSSKGFYGCSAIPSVLS